MHPLHCRWMMQEVLQTQLYIVWPDLYKLGIDSQVADHQLMHSFNICTLCHALSLSNIVAAMQETTNHLAYLLKCLDWLYSWPVVYWGKVAHTLTINWANMYVGMVLVHRVGKPCWLADKRSTRYGTVRRRLLNIRALLDPGLVQMLLFLIDTVPVVRMWDSCTWGYQQNTH